PVRAASTANVTLATPGATMDGVTLTSGDRVLLKNQSTGSQNGIYTWSGAATTLVRTADADSAADFVLGFQVFVREGTTNGSLYWWYSTSTSPIVLESTSLAFTVVTGAAGAAGATGPAGPTGASGAPGTFII